MSIKSFFKWTRDNQSKFAADITTELAKKIDTESVQKMIDAIPPPPPADTGVSKNGDTMTGVLEIAHPPAAPAGTAYPLILKGKFYDTSTEYVWKLGVSTISQIFYIRHNTQDLIGISSVLGLFPAINSPNFSLGWSGGMWSKTYTKKLNNGADIEIPNKAGTLALVSDIEDILKQHGLI